jgi:hypothetical protein
MIRRESIGYCPESEIGSKRVLREVTQPPENSEEVDLALDDPVGIG